MRTFELVDGETPGAAPCAVITCDQAAQRFGAEVAEWAGPEDVPLMFSPFVERGERTIPERWVRAWVDERIAPPSRQNIGEVLREHGLDEYDALELLLSGEGRSSQDGFYLREITDDYRDAARLGREFARARAEAGLTQEELAERSGIRQETLSRLERGRVNPTAKTLEKLARALGKQLRITLV